MDTVQLALGATPIDIAAFLSAGALTTTPPRPGLDGRGAAKLYNASVDASLYVAIQPTMPDGSTAAFRVRPQTWFPEELHVTAAGGVWAWASRDGTMAIARITGWS